MSSNAVFLGALLMSAAVVVCGSAQAQERSNANFAGMGAARARFGVVHFQGGRMGPMHFGRHNDERYHDHDRRRDWRHGGARYFFGPFVGGLAAAPYFEAAPSYYSSDYYAPPTDEAIAYCMQRFPSYDFWSHTYLGIDGYRHPCP